MNTSPKILLIEDNEDDAELTSIALAKAGRKELMHWVKDGVEALDLLLGRNNYTEDHWRANLAIVFLDLKLPKQNGFEVLQLLNNNNTAVPPICVLTSSNVESDIDKAYALGANSYIVKPIDFKEHISSVNKAVDFWFRYAENNSAKMN
jgi:two-component system response regulator